MSQRPLSHFLFAAPFFVTLCVSGASCVSLYELNNFNSAVSMLCAMVAECQEDFYPKCVEQAGARLENATPEERSQFLINFTDTGCLETCTAAQGCFDQLPLCAASASACSVEAQCCGFWDNGAQCAASSCCQPNGVACETSADCCAADCIEGPAGKTCGGTVCAALNESCSTVSCCGDGEGDLRCSTLSQTCQHCEALDGVCESGADCCSNYCDNADTGDATGVCGNPGCGFLGGQPCTNASECCDEFCVKVGRSDSSVCNDMDCVPNEFGCDETTKCCSGSCVDNLCSDPFQCSANLGEDCDSPLECCDGVCGDEASKCCLLDTEECSATSECCGASQCRGAANGTPPTCQGTSMCVGHGGGCTDANDCCSKSCELGSGLCCKIVTPPCPHGVCTISEDPLALICSEADTDNGSIGTEKTWGQPGCMADICGQLPHCCCDQWDQACVDAATTSTTCKVTCSVDTEPI